MPSRIRYGLLIGTIFIGLFLTSFNTSHAGSINYIYDELRRLYQVVDPQGNVTTYNYDASGNILSITRSTYALVVSGISPNSASKKKQRCQVLTLGVPSEGQRILTGGSPVMVEARAM